MNNNSISPWVSMQRDKRKRQAREKIKRSLKKLFYLAILFLAIYGFITLIANIFGYKLNIEKARAEETSIEQPIVTEETKAETSNIEQPKLSDDRIIEALKSVCSTNGMADEKNNKVCWQTLWAMSYQESKLGYLMTGDQGRSKGWFHIQIKMHNITEECARDLDCSADWTLKRLIAKGFPVYWTYSVQSHNGFGTPAAKQGEYAKIIAREIADIKN